MLSAACPSSSAIRFAQAVASADGSATTWLAGPGATACFLDEALRALAPGFRAAVAPG
ncbi:hypothetical protein GCM10022403_050150 [Streptomyces coacervatus]|uniref:Uncharacterized protein n=1 Tax=Streptomyces coacervatus TaxID=647381 RepID=A0ABP7I4G4_9ACTN|nr:hypothetical protein [Streptomyces coacervatus]MDF2266139.1 hypothetical protein [Streptomyces coacervatus]